MFLFVYDAWTGWEIGAYFSMQSTVFISLWLRCFHSFYEFSVGHSMAQQGWKLVLDSNHSETTPGKQSMAIRYKDCFGVCTHPLS